MKRLRKLFLELPQELRLAYCLARDPRTPAPLKASLAGALAVILNPLLDIPSWIPVVGGLDTISLTLLAVKTFNSQAPPELRRELEAEIRSGQSRFDQDLAQGMVEARRLARRLRRLGPGSGAPPPSAATTAPPAWYRSAAAAEGAGGPEGSEAEPAPAPTNPAQESPS